VCGLELQISEAVNLPDNFSLVNKPALLVCECVVRKKRAKGCVCVSSGVGTVPLHDSARHRADEDVDLHVGNVGSGSLMVASLRWYFPHACPRRFCISQQLLNHSVSIFLCAMLPLIHHALDAIWVYSLQHNTQPTALSATPTHNDSTVTCQALSKVFHANGMISNFLLCIHWALTETTTFQGSDCSFRRATRSSHMLASDWVHDPKAVVGTKAAVVEWTICIIARKRDGRWKVVRAISKWWCGV